MIHLFKKKYKYSLITKKRQTVTNISDYCINCFLLKHHFALHTFFSCFLSHRQRLLNRLLKKLIRKYTDILLV